MTASITEQKLTIPTYLLKDSESLPLFLEKRAYQGSSGKVYPYRVADQLSEQKVEQVYQAVVLENRYLKITILPELGGRIQAAYDKIKGRHFVYHNQVIKPALVGLTGPWISGGIEFNWPQHHRPSTFEAVEYRLEESGESEDGSVAVYLGELERMNGLQQCLAIRLRPEHNYLELKGRIFNTSALPQTFLWWANPAVKAEGGHQSIFPPDVNAVYDHGKRDVSRFPIAIGEYYKADYSAGVDISRYDNIAVPTSYMAWRSDYNFVGAYSHNEGGGLLHVANHHIAPGKKQWTWGNGDFGQVWDRNLTDGDGPYIELMTGVYTDNQPDFTWLSPYEEKQFTQYFMPYRELGQIQNASERVALKCELKKDAKHPDGILQLGLLAFGPEADLQLELHADSTLLHRESLHLDPEDCWTKELPLPEEYEVLYCAVLDSERTVLLDYRLTKKSGLEEIEEIPEAASRPLPPEQIQHSDELFFVGQHIEQYRNPSLEAESYYAEILRRDPKDYRANLAMGRLQLRAFRYQAALDSLEAALRRQTKRNTNPIDGEASYLKGLALLQLKREEAALSCFYKAAWSFNYKASALYYVAVIHCRRQQWSDALQAVNQSVHEQGCHWQARSLKAYILRNGNDNAAAIREAEFILSRQPLHMIALLELYFSRSAALDIPDSWLKQLRHESHNLLSVAYLYQSWGASRTAADVLARIPADSDPLQYYAQAYVAASRDQPFREYLARAEQCRNFRHFPNKEGDYAALQFAVSQNPQSLAQYHLGNLLYDRKRYDEAFASWQALPQHAPSRRNSSIYLYNKRRDTAAALKELEEALRIENSLQQTNPRMLFEYNYLLKCSRQTAAQRLDFLASQDPDVSRLVSQRDDLLLEYLECLLIQGEYGQALSQIKVHVFHPWEGGEGKVANCYVHAAMGQAIGRFRQGHLDAAVEELRCALVYPENINEGKLPTTTDNNIYYLLGCFQYLNQEKDSAVLSWEKACLGRSDPSLTSYYNDAPLDYILYRALAHRSLGHEREANRLSYRLLDFGERNLNRAPEADFFAVSMPDFTVYELDRQQEFREQCLFALLLGSIGLGDRSRAEGFGRELLRENPNHLKGNLLLDFLPVLLV